MGINLGKFLPVYFDEGYANIAILEAGLRELAPTSVAPEVLERSLRAVHSVKGSSGTFGFDDVAALAQALEDILRRASQPGAAPLTAASLAACSEAAGVLRTLMRCHQQEQSAEAGVLASMLTRLAAILPEDDTRKGVDR